MSKVVIEWKQGWAIQFKRKDGTTFLAGSGAGEQPAIFSKCNRKWAVKHKNVCLETGNMGRPDVKGKVVAVLYANPIIVEIKK